MKKLWIALLIAIAWTTVATAGGLVPDSYPKYDSARIANKVQFLMDSLGVCGEIFYGGVGSTDPDSLYAITCDTRDTINLMGGAAGGGPYLLLAGGVMDAGASIATPSLVIDSTSGSQWSILTFRDTAGATYDLLYDSDDGRFEMDANVYVNGSILAAGQVWTSAWMKANDSIVTPIIYLDSLIVGGDTVTGLFGTAIIDTNGTVLINVDTTIVATRAYADAVVGGSTDSSLVAQYAHVSDSLALALLLAGGSMSANAQIDMSGGTIVNVDTILATNATDILYVMGTNSAGDGKIIFGAHGINAGDTVIFAYNAGSAEYRTFTISTPDDSISAEGNKITMVADPDNDQDAATKKYVDDNAGGLDSGEIMTVVRDTLSSATGMNEENIRNVDTLGIIGP
ncbi:unnamed protein product, partial [marine sediment metagenome]